MSKDRQPVIYRYITLLLHGLYQVTYGLYIRLFYRLRHQNKHTVPKKGPYLLLANHSNNFDGLFLQCIIKRPIHFVVTDAMFKKRFLGKMMNIVGFIPKRKLVSDSKAIRQIIRAIRQGKIVGIFPEAGRNWDGKTGAISPATYRLAELLRVPIVTACMKGAYLSEPRWAETKRRGLVEVTFQTHFEKDERPSLEQIEREVSAALTHNEAVWQKQEQIVFKGKALSRGFERLLFICPNCKRIGTMESLDERVRCLACGAAYRLDSYGFVHAVNGLLPAHNIPELNEWQLRMLADLISNAKPGIVLLSDEGAILYHAKAQNMPFEYLAEGSLNLNLNHLIIGQHEFELYKIHGVSVYFNTHIEFRYKGLDYRIGFNEKRVSAYKWNCALEMIKDL